MDTKWQFDQSSTADEVVKGHNLDGKIMLVTGANTGIGFETARALASAGARVILACRNTDSGNAAVEKIKHDHPGSSAECVQLDLASLPAVRDRKSVV